MKLAFSSNGYLRYSISETIARVAALGYSGIELLADVPHAWPAGLLEEQKQAIRDALTAADASIDFSQFDKDSDGFVDAIAFIHSGYGAEWGGTDAYGTVACGAGDIYRTRFSPVTGTWAAPRNLGCAPDGPNGAGVDAARAPRRRGAGGRVSGYGRGRKLSA